jgi:hypothetical protein
MISFCNRPGKLNDSFESRRYWNEEQEADLQYFTSIRDKFSSWLKLIRCTAWIYKFIRKTQKLAQNKDELTTDELEWVKTCWYKYQQSKHYKEEINTLNKKLVFCER